MAEHPNVSLLRKAYEAGAKGDMATLTAVLAEDAVWHVPGRTPFSGEHKGHDAILAALGRGADLSGGTIKIEPHDILANDEHAVALTRATATRAGKKLDMLGTDVFHMRGGKITEFWSFWQDQRLFDDFWGAEVAAGQGDVSTQFEEYFIEEEVVKKQTEDELRADYKQYEAALAEFLGPELAAQVVDNRVHDIITTTDEEFPEGKVSKVRFIRLHR